MPMESIMTEHRVYASDPQSHGGSIQAISTGNIIVVVWYCGDERAYEPAKLDQIIKDIDSLIVTDDDSFAPYVWRLVPSADTDTVFVRIEKGIFYYATGTSGAEARHSDEDYGYMPRWSEFRYALNGALTDYANNKKGKENTA